MKPKHPTKAEEAALNAEGVFFTDAVQAWPDLFTLWRSRKDGTFTASLHGALERRRAKLWNAGRTYGKPEQKATLAALCFTRDEVFSESLQPLRELFQQAHAAKNLPRDEAQAIADDVKAKLGAVVDALAGEHHEAKHAKKAYGRELVAIETARAFVAKWHRLPTKKELRLVLIKLPIFQRLAMSKWTDLWEDAGLKPLP